MVHPQVISRFVSLGFEWVFAGQQAADVETSGACIGPGGFDAVLSALLTWNWAQAVAGFKAVAFFAQNEVPLQQVGVVLHLGDVVQFVLQALLRELHDLDAAGLVVVDGNSDGEFDLLGSGALAVHATGELRSHFFVDVLRAGIVAETERLDTAFR